MRHAWGLTARLLWLGLLPALLAMLALGWLLHGSIRDSLYGGLAHRLDEHANRIQASLSVSPAGQWRYEAGRSNDAFGQIFSGWYWVLDADGQTLYSRSLWDASLQPGARQTHMDLVRNTDPRGRPLLGVERTIEVDGHVARLAVYALADEVSADLARIRRILMLVLAAMLLATAITTVVQVRVGLRPLLLLRQRLARLHGTIPPAHEATSPSALGQGYGPELDPLAHEIDALLERNARMLARSRAHAADLSHALKTPLARLSAEASRTAQVPSPLVLEQVDRIDGLIERHLSRTTSAGGLAPRLQQAVPVHEVAQQLVQLMQQIRPEKRLRWQVDGPAALRWRGDRADLEEMLGNLLDNASKWAATTVQVRLEAMGGRTASGRSPGELMVRIADDGPGIPAELLERAGQRGQRFDESTPGSGLGLSIAADIAHTWGGHLQLGASTSLGGLEARLQLPGVLPRP